MTNGVLFGAPIPEPYTTVGKELQEAVERAVRESQENGIDKRGKEVTPWLLKRVSELTSGRSLASSECISRWSLQFNEWFPWADIALIENTALKGAQIAVSYAELAEQQSTEPRHSTAVRP
jgi:pseudouridine-5'-phosphate glycosidase/pseudouridine kinase